MGGFNKKERYYFLIMFKRNFITKNYILYENVRIFAKKIESIIKNNYRNSIKKTILEINKNKNKKYIIFHNPTFLGVSSATKELFENLVPCTDVYFLWDVNKIVKAIIDNNIKEVYFSAFCYNWKKIVTKLKKENSNIVIKTFWHGSHSQVLDTYGWLRNSEIINLHKKDKVDQMATCKKSMLEFYDENKFNSHFLNNTVYFDGKKYKENKVHDGIKIGIYSANGDWRKNMMCQVAAVKLLKNASIDMVPLNKEAKKLADSLDIIMEGPNKPILREDLFKRMSKNDVNLYITFSECAPMLPLESLEVGVPCITGNNHHFFKGTELEKYLVVNNETDIEEIKKKIEKCIKEKETILKLYKTWKKENDSNTKKQIKSYLGGVKNEK